jgi:DNA-directed RNA polymerase specialized sigma24 family protein
MLRFFAGLAMEEIAELLGVSTRTVEREWRFARAWLSREMAGEVGPAGEEDA